MPKELQRPCFGISYSSAWRHCLSSLYRNSGCKKLSSHKWSREPPTPATTLIIKATEADSASSKGTAPYVYMPCDTWRSSRKHFSLKLSTMRVFSIEGARETLQEEKVILQVLALGWGVTPNSHSWDKSHLVMMYNPFYMLLNSVCYYFVEDFHVYIHKGY